MVLLLEIFVNHWIAKKIGSCCEKSKSKKENEDAKVRIRDSIFVCKECVLSIMDSISLSHAIIFLFEGFGLCTVHDRVYDI